jgi:hypothetical protein
MKIALPGYVISAVISISININGTYPFDKGIASKQQAL